MSNKKKKKKLLDEEWRRRNKSRISTVLVLSVFVMLILIVALVIASVVVLLVQNVKDEEVVLDLRFTLLMVLGISAFMGYGLAVLLGSTVLLKPINRLVSAMDSLASGNFDTRLDFKGTVFNNDSFRSIASGFNSMAEELGSTEMLRSDFINNFSHEFKTPIVSIAGFCDLLRSEDLSDEERDHYLSIIGQESRRLSSLATNILNLTKIENQNILTDISEFNLSEQIRSALLLLESKWGTRGIIPSLEFDEINIRANEQLLKEVWLNLLDNAIKFSPDGGEIAVAMTERFGRITVSITNSGDEIPADAREKIFRKFYQADESHSTEGSGVGLAVVKKVVELHHGSVRVSCLDGKTTFTVSLPNPGRRAAIAAPARTAQSR